MTHTQTTDPTAALAATESVAFGLAAYLALGDDQAESLRRAASYVLLGRREDGLPITPQDEEDDRLWAQELATSWEGAMSEEAETELVRLWAAQRRSGNG